MGAIEKTSENAKMKQSEEHGSSSVRVPAPSSCRNSFSYTFRLKLPRAKVRRRKTQNIKLEEVRDNATKKGANE